MSSNRFKEEQVFEGGARFNVLPVKPLDILPPTDTTPSVQNLEYFKCVNTGPVTVTDFDNASDTQTIHVLGEGQTTVANNANIKTTTGANKLLVAGKLYRFTHIEGVWYEHG